MSDEARKTTWEGRKETTVDKPHEVWVNDSGWEWRVLKKWQKDDNKPYARWMCAVKSPYTYGGWDYGDVYVSEIKAGAFLVEPVVKETRKVVELDKETY